MKRVIVLFLLIFFAVGGVSFADDMIFNDNMIWIQLGNQIKDIDEKMFDEIEECNFKKIVLLHSSVDDKGYFPVLNKIVEKAHNRGIKTAIGTLVFKDTFQKKYWEKNPSLRHCSKDGTYTENKYYHYQICPNNPLNHEYIASLMVKKARESGADEIHIDYEISPCYCPYCLEKFSEDTGLNALDLPENDKTWMTWRSRSTRDFFALLARKARSSDPPLRISSTAPIIGFQGGFTAYGTEMRYEDLTIYTDEFQPMIYISVKNPASMAGEKYEAVKLRLKGKRVVPGIIINEEFTSNIKSPERIEEELRSLYDKGADSIAVFEVRYINEGIKELFKARFSK